MKSIPPSSSPQGLQDGEQMPQSEAGFVSAWSWPLGCRGIGGLVGW